ncbi:type VII secretion target [Mycolicibacterium sp. A43C]
MGYIDSARMDVTAVLGAAQRYDSVAGILDDAVGRAHVVFGAAGAGREYADGGALVQRAVTEALGQLRAWAAANREIASSLRISAADYADIDARAARRIG